MHIVTKPLYWKKSKEIEQENKKCKRNWKKMKNKHGKRME